MREVLATVNSVTESVAIFPKVEIALPLWDVGDNVSKDTNKAK
jgi:hypothetical protein